MPPPVPTEHAHGEVEGAPAPPATLDAIVSGLASHGLECGTVAEYLKRSLPTLATGFRAVCGALEARGTATVARFDWFHDDADPEFWKRTLESLLSDATSAGKPRARLYRGRTEDVRVALFGIPFRAGAHADGAVALVAPCEGRGHAEELLDRLTALASLLAFFAPEPPADRAREGAGVERVASIKKVAGFESERELAFALTNRLRARDADTELVALAAVDRRRVRVLSISGFDSVVERSPGARAITAAAEECVDLDRTLVAQKAGELDETVVTRDTPLHRAWSECSGHAAVASIPLRVEGRSVAVLSIRRSGSSPFHTSDLQELRDLVEPYAASLDLVRRAGRSFPAHARAAAATALSAWLVPRSWSRRAVTVGAALFALWFLFGSLPYRLSVPATVRPADRRTIAAPFDGVLRQAPFLPGDEVAAGTVLCELDARELRLEEARLTSELEVLHVEEARALAEDQPVDREVVAARLRQVGADLDLVRFRIARAQLVAPFDGTVLLGDLRDRVGDSVAKGTALVELVPRRALELELHVPERVGPLVKAGLEGSFHSHSRPDEGRPLVVRRVHPGAERREDENVFRARATAELDPEWIRPGMEGVARIDAGRRAPWWLLLHEVTDRLRMWLWL